MPVFYRELRVRIRPISLPTTLPHPDAIRSHEHNRHAYEPDFWEFQYESYRYLRELTDAELILRYLSIFRNMQALVNRERHVIPITMFLSSWYWYRKEHQTRYEFALRKLDPPRDPPHSCGDVSIIAGPGRPRFPNGLDALFRYGKLEHLLSMVKCGTVRISPADDFTNLEEDEARKDDELNKHCFLPRSYSRVTTIDGRNIPLNGDIKRTVSQPNYFMFCTSCDWDTSLFESFEANACAVIRKPLELSMRMKLASKSKLADWYFHDNPVVYFDPYENLIEGRVFDAATCKDFRFAYQQEYRFIWVGGELRATEPIYLNVGPLEDISEIYQQDGSRIF
jgi:hypothetical protein